MLVAISSLTLTGLVVGFVLWIGIIVAVRLWGPSGDEEPPRRPPE